MVNHRLRAAINAAGLTYVSLAKELNVSAKTVDRWINKAALPYPRHRIVLVARFGKPETFFWPELDEVTPEEEVGLGTDEIVRVYPYRTSVPAFLWGRLLRAAEDRIDLLLYAGSFLLEAEPDLADLLAKKAADGTRVRLLLGDPACAAVTVRGREEGIGDAVAAKVRNVVRYYRPLENEPNVDVRFHQTTLYASLYQFDDEMLVNTHVYGLCAAHAPVIHLRRRSGGPLFETYIMNFERVWQNASPTWLAT